MNKSPAVNQKMTPELLLRVIERSKGMEGDYRSRGAALALDFPEFTARTMTDYARVAAQASPYAVQQYCEGKLSLGSLTALTPLPHDMQDAIINAPKLDKREMGRGRIHALKRLLAEGMSMEESLKRALGILPQERAPSNASKSLDALLQEAAALGTKWRAKINTAIEGLRAAEMEGGIYIPLFEKAVMLRQVVGEQYEFVNKTVRRYLKVMEHGMKGTQ